MSEQRHTPEPWFVKSAPDNDMISCDYVGGKGLIYCTSAVDTISNEEREANARRIVACVNACAGVSTADLEQYGDAFADGYISVAEREKLQARVKELEAQRDELLEALKEAADSISCTGQSYSEHDSDPRAAEESFETEVRWMRDLVAKIEAEKTNDSSQPSI